jgi:cysteine-rich repeat protein
MSHASMVDVDAHLISPAGNTNGLFTDVGNAAFPNVDITVDDEGAYPAASFTLLNGLVVQPELDYRLHWLDGENGGGNWTLALDDDTNNASGGTLLGWSVTICDAPIPAVTCAMGAVPLTPLTADFEAGDQGFTHAGAGDEWARGTPSFAPITTCNSGTQCWKTDLANTYNASSNQDLISPPINLAQAKAPIQLRWAMKYQLETASNDHAWVEIREVGGANPKRLWEFRDATMTIAVGNPATTLQESAGWGTHFADIGAYAGKQVEVVFHLDSSAAGQYAGLAVDDVGVVCCPVAVCGNGVVEPGETCDDSNLTSGDGCDSNCTPTGCGNGIVTMGEACDDGNPTSGDGCDSNCTATACGNGVVTAGEICDDGNGVIGDGCDDGMLGNCTASACGNGVKAPNEGCDDGNLTSGDGCDSELHAHGCGNGVVTMGEACDDGNPMRRRRLRLQLHVTACGNGIVTAGEVCDDGNAVDGDGCDTNCT